MMTKKSNQKGIFLFFMFISFCLLADSLNFSTNNNSIIESNSDFDITPKSNDVNIDIVTPENKTYTAPMSGFYPGTFGFENDIAGSIPKNWTDESTGDGCYIDVLDSYDNHNKVLRLYDPSVAQYAVAEDKFNEAPRSSGTIEFWWQTSMDTVDVATLMGGYSYNESNYIIYLNQAGNRLRHWQNGGYTLLDTIISINTWYNIRVDFEATTGGYMGLEQFKIDIYVNGVKDSNGPFDFHVGSNISDIDSVSVSTRWSYAMNYYYDAISYSWNPNYNIGDNMEEGLLLSFENSTNLDTWMGYSLDGQANKTILGNTTIPMPSDGSHNIQVFGNDSLGTDYKSELRYFEINYIKIATPENVTYTNPMSGYYPATWGFENDLIGIGPSGWDLSLNTGGCTSLVYASQSGHNNILQLNDNTGGGKAVARDFFSSVQQSGTVEFWINNMDTLKDTSVWFDGIGGTIGYGIFSGSHQYWDGSWHVIETASSNQWYHIRIDFDCTGGGYESLTEDDWHLYIDGTKKSGAGYNMVGTPASLSYILFGTSQGESGVITYVDAVGYSWDPNYNIGDNLNEGLLLGYENFTNLDWMAYSLDSRANITILGNTTIAMPNNGLHTIQVFGNDSLGIDYHSEVRYFTIDDGFIFMAANATNYWNTSVEPGVNIILEPIANAYLKVSRSITKFSGIDNPWGDLTPYYFYSINVYNENFEKDNSVIDNMTIRFYYNPAKVSDPNDLYVLRYVWKSGAIWAWESIDITLNTAGNYVEFSPSSLSFFCLGEITVIPSLEDDPFWIFIMDNLIIIIILSAMGVTIPTAYILTTKSKKKKNEEFKGKKAAMDQYQEVDMDTAFRLKAEKKKEELMKRTWSPEEITKQPETITKKDLDIKAKKKPMKKLKKAKGMQPMSIDAIAEAEEIRRKEIEATEKELTIKAKLDKCTIHKGSIEGISYVCPKCHAKYCLNCAKTIKKKSEGCWVCDAPIKMEGEASDQDISIIPLDPQEFKDVQILSADEQYEHIFLNSSSILQIWMLDSQNNSYFYSETLVPDDNYSLIIPQILSESYEKDTFVERAFKIGNKQIFALIYFSKYLVNMIILSKNRIDTTFYGNIKTVIDHIEEDYVNLKESPKDITNILNQGIFLYLSKEYATIPPEMQETLQKIFKNQQEREFIQSEVLKMPEGTFAEFLELYSTIRKEKDEINKETDEERDYYIK